MGYSKFIAVGVERQQNSITVDEATRNYARSCECCMKQGRNFNYDCDYNCPITIAHREKLETILTLRQIEHAREMQKESIERKLAEIEAKVEKIYEVICTPKELDERNEELDELTEEWMQTKGEVNYVRGI